MINLILKIVAVTLVLSVFLINSSTAYARTRLSNLEQRVSKLETRCFGGPQSHLRAETIDCLSLSSVDCANASACGCFDPLDPDVSGYKPICCECGYYPAKMCYDPNHIIHPSTPHFSKPHMKSFPGGPIQD